MISDHLIDRTGALEAAAEEFSAEQIAQLASEEAMRQVSALQAQLDALQRENANLRQQRTPGSAPDRVTAAELGALKQELAALRAENARLRDQRAPAEAQPRNDPVLQRQLNMLRRENAALRAKRLVSNRIARGDVTQTADSDSLPPRERQQEPSTRHDDAAPSEEVYELQRLLEAAHDVARRHENEAQRLAAEVTVMRTHLPPCSDVRPAAVLEGLGTACSGGARCTCL